MYGTFRSLTSPRAAALLATSILLVAPLLTGCGGSDSDDEPTTTRTAPNGDVFNQADVTFAQQMIPHHAQAIEMADLTRKRDLSPEVAALADQILGAQAPEIETMTGWLTAWEEEVPETSRDHANAHSDEQMDMSGEMPGMMSPEEMESLASAPDAQFEDMWLEMMVEHHQGAIEMARTEQRDGEFADAIAMAQNIESGQADEVEQMTGLLGS